MNLNLEKISAEEGTGKLLIRDWIWDRGYWKPSLAVTDERPEIKPGNYTLGEALGFYGYDLEID